jgi:molybdopterin-guanine dinucleotide biosynthesis protein A
MDCRIVHDIYTGCGPIGGLHAVLQAAAGDGMDGVAVVACDMPFVKAGLYRYIYEQLREDRRNAFVKYDGIVAVTEDGMHPLVAIYSVKAADVLGEQLEKGIYRLTAALSRLRIFYVDLTGSGLVHMLVNINTTEEYEALVRAGASPAGRRRDLICDMR